LNDIQVDRGTKRTCQSCEARFYDLGRTPVICPKCGADYIEPVRAAPLPRQPRKTWPFGKDRQAATEAEDGADTASHRDQPEDDEERDSGEEAERELDGEAEPLSDAEEE